MRKDLTKIVIILDRSGSMQSVTDDTIGGYNAFINLQKEEAGDANVTLVLFDNEYELVYNNINIQEVPELTTKEYFARGTTAMFDAIGKTINIVGAELANVDESERPSNVIFSITTDGYENASKEFTKDKINEMINHQQDVYNWKFIFTAANMDAASEGTSMGIKSAMTMNFNSEIGDAAYALFVGGINTAITSLRRTGEVSDTWSEDINTISTPSN